ncbi:MAG: 4Fe-4S binding protein [Chloroflexi bacterium]|nr:4Fe-4S binding protein [Chloroflexota bacterium]
MSVFMPVINEQECIACGNCVDDCHTGALALIEGIPQIIDEGACDYCTECEEICPTGAISCPFEIDVIA